MARNSDPIFEETTLEELRLSLSLPSRQYPLFSLYRISLLLLIFFKNENLPKVGIEGGKLVSMSSRSSALPRVRLVTEELVEIKPMACVMPQFKDQTILRKPGRFEVDKEGNSVVIVLPSPSFPPTSFSPFSRSTTSFHRTCSPNFFSNQ